MSSEHRLEPLLEAILDSWDRNNRILVNLLRAIPVGGMQVRAMPGSPSVAQMFTHMDTCRLWLLQEDSPEFALPLPTEEWREELDKSRLEAMLNLSAKAVRDAVKNRIETGTPMIQHYDHPVLLFQHKIWHEGYHQGQIKLALKIAGIPFDDEEIGPATWDLWMDKRTVNRPIPASLFKPG